MSKAISKEKQAQLLLEPGFALELVRAARINNIYKVSEGKSVDLVRLVSKSLLAIENEKLGKGSVLLLIILAVRLVVNIFV